MTGDDILQAYAVRQELDDIFDALMVLQYGFNPYYWADPRRPRRVNPILARWYSEWMTHTAP